MSEIVQTVLSNFIDWLFKPLDNAASSMITGAFTGTAGTVSNSQWNIAITAANRIGWIMGFVNMAICIIGSLHAAVKGSVAESVKSFAMCVLAWPLTAVSVSVMITLEGIVGTVSAKILNVQLSGDTASGEFSDSVVSNLVGTATKYSAQTDMLIRLAVYVLVWFASLALSGMLAARLLSLVLLAAVAPLPIMMSGWRTTRPAALKWVEAVAGVMLVKPLSALILMVGSALLNVANNDTNVSSSFFPTLIGLATLFMCCFSPRLVMPAVSFIGTNVTGEMQERGGKVGPGAVKTAAQVTAGIVASATAGLSGVGGATSGLADMGSAACSGETRPVRAKPSATCWAARTTNPTARASIRIPTPHPPWTQPAGTSRTRPTRQGGPVRRTVCRQPCLPKRRHRIVFPASMTRTGPIWTGSMSERPICRSPNPFPGFPPRTADGTVPVPRHLPKPCPAHPEAGEATPPLPEGREAMAAMPARRRSPGHRAAGEATPPRMAAREAVAAMAASVSPRRRPAARQARPSADLISSLLFGSRPRDSTWNPRRGPFPLCPDHAIIAFFGGVGFP